MRKTKITRKNTKKRVFSQNNSKIESLMEFGFIASATFRTILIGISMFQTEILNIINISQVLFVNILSFATLFYLGFALIHFVFSIVFVAKEKENDYVIPSLSTAIVMFMIVLFV